MKVAVITDTHFCFKKFSKVYHDYFERFYSNVFFPTLEDRKITHVIHMGDAFDNRRGVDYWGLEWAQRVVYNKFRDLSIEVYQIMGNHDAYHKNTNTINSVETLLYHYDNIIPITDPKEYNIGGLDCLMLPWICKDNEQRTFELIQNTKAKVVFGHLELQGFSLFPGHPQTHGMSVEKFEKFDRVYSGHYHTRSNDGKIFYLGNPYQMFWSDVNDKRGFSIFDTETYEIEFIENPYYMYEKIYYSDLDYKKFDFSTLENKNVKVLVQQRTNQLQYEKFISEILKRNIVDLKISETVDLESERVDIINIDSEDTLSILNKYIEDADFNLNKNKVKKILQDVYKEAIELEIA